MRKNHSNLFYQLLHLTVAGIFYFLFSMPALASDMLRLHLTITDFYDPLLTGNQSQILLNKLKPEEITITGTYEPIRDKSKQHIKRVYRPNCMVGVTCFGGKWVTEKVYQYYPAQAIHYDAQQQQITFELPKPLETAALAYVIPYIKLTTPFFSITVPYPHQENPVYYSTQSLQSSLNLENPDPNDRYPYVYLHSNKGIIAELRELSKAIKAQPIANTFSEQDKKRLYAQRSLSHYNGFINISIPESLPSWHNINNSSKAFRATRGLFVNDQHIEAVILAGDVADKQADSGDAYYREEYWLKQNGKLTHIYLNPIHIPRDDCDFVYGITFFSDGTEERYFAHQIKQSERSDEKLLEKKKIFVTPDNLAVLDEYEAQREQHYANVQERYPTIKNHFPACQRMITDAKRLLSTPKLQLEKEFKQYQKIIQAADKKRRQGY